MKNSQQIKEAIEVLAIEARGIVDACQRTNRELTEDEDKRFKEITAKDSSGLIYNLQAELKQAEEREASIRSLSEQAHRKTTMQELGDILNPTQQPERVLPTNGIVPGENRQPARVYHRMAKLKAFKNDKDAYDCGMWIRAVVARVYNRPVDNYAENHVRMLGWKITASQTEGSGPAGGFLVPAPLAQTIIDVRETVGVARRIARIMPMTSDTLDMPRREGGLTVVYPGEGGLITASDKTWGQIAFIAKKRAVANQISQELVDDALISVVDDAVSEMAYALADQEDAEMILGDGTATYGGETGLISAIGAAGVVDAAAGHDTWAELDATDFSSVMGALPDKYGRMPVWVCSRNFYYTSMFKLLISGGGNTISTLEQGNSQFGPNTAGFLGSPVYFTDKMPKTTAAATICALYGTFEMGVIIGDRMGIAIGRSDEYAFLNDLTTLKATSRYDINVHAPGDATDAGAYVALKTAA